MRWSARIVSQARLPATFPLALVVWIAIGLSVSSFAADGRNCQDCAAQEASRILHQATRPRWSMRGTGLYLDRASEGELVLAENTTDASERIRADDFDFGRHAGFAVALRREWWTGHAIELQYFDAGQLDASSGGQSASSLWSINADPPVFVPNVQSVAARYTSALFGFEADFSYSLCDDVSLLAGFRYLSLDEDLTIDFDSTPQAYRNRSETRNDLYGGSFGVRGSHAIHGCLLATATAKGGVFGNHARHRGLLDTGASSLVIDETSDRTSFAGELDVAAVLRICPSLRASVGYNLLWLESVAIAADQIAVSNYVGGTGIDDRGGTLFHGMSYSVELRF